MAFRNIDFTFLEMTRLLGKSKYASSLNSHFQRKVKKEGLTKPAITLYRDMRFCEAMLDP